MNSYFRLGICALLPCVLSILLKLLGRRAFFKKIPFRIRQIFYGVLFGGLAVLGTEWGIPMKNAVVNCRDSAVICAGLFFSAPAGVIAGLIGGIERWFTATGGPVQYTRLACTVATISTGFFSALLNYRLFDKKWPRALISLSCGIVMEIFHLEMIFLTHMSDPNGALTAIRAIAVPMVAANSLAVMLTSIVLNRLFRKDENISLSEQTISQHIQKGLAIAVAVAFVLTSVFVVTLQDRIAKGQARNLLLRSNDEVIRDISDLSDREMIHLANDAATELPFSSLDSIAEKYGLDEINVVDRKGIIRRSTNPDYLGFDMASGTQSGAFLTLLTSKKEYVQDYGSITHDSDVKMKYAGVSLESGFLQVGFNAGTFLKNLAANMEQITVNREVGATGYVVILDSDNNVVSAPVAHRTDIRELSPADDPEGEMFVRKLRNTECYVRKDVISGCSIYSIYPVEEAMQARTFVLYLNTFTEITILAFLFAMIYLLIRKVVVDGIHQFNRSLSRITSGNLDEIVDVRSSREFESLSDDINATVSTLKRYIAEASARIDRELEVARSIQSSSLPKFSPGLTGEYDVELFPFMRPAREVGGDFYDFYMTDAEHLHFVIADVSGKGIPAAMFMMRARTELRNTTMSGADQEEVFSKTNRALCGGNDAEMFVTAWQGCLDLKTGVLNFINAGHNRPLIRHQGGQFEMLNSKSNFILGGMETVRYKSGTLQLQEGDTLFLYTDGVTEATNGAGKLYGDDRLLITAGTCGGSMEELVGTVVRDIDLFADNEPQFDDITMLAIRYKGQNAWTIRFEEADIAQIPEITEKAEEELERIGCSQKTIIQMSIAIDEIYSNIVKYAYPQKKGPAELSIRLNADRTSVQMTFRDFGLPYNPLTSIEPDITLSARDRKIGGLGIHIVRKTMDEVLYRYEKDMNIFTLKKNL